MNRKAPRNSSASQLLFRDNKGNVKNPLSVFEGITFRENPLDFFIVLARYKFAARLLRRDHTVLDAGCGYGVGTAFLSKFSRYATGGDFDVEMVEHNREEYACLPNVEFCELDLLNVAKHKRRYDVVVSLDVIEHFPRCKAETVASSYAKLLRPGGFAIVGTPNKVSAAWASKRRLQSHAYEFGPKDFESVLRSSFKRVFLFSMTDEIVSTSFLPLAWYLMAVCTK